MACRLPAAPNDKGPDRSQALVITRILGAGKRPQLSRLSGCRVRNFLSVGTNLALDFAESRHASASGWDRKDALGRFKRRLDGYHLNRGELSAKRS